MFSIFTNVAHTVSLGYLWSRITSSINEDIMPTRMRGINFQAGKRMVHLSLIYNETLKRKEREAREGLEKVANRVVAESFENSRNVSFSQRHCVN